MLAADYSDARPDPHALKAAGYDGVYRYLAPLPNPKVLTDAELVALHAAGLGVGLIWEGLGTAALYGASQGHADSLEANRQADLLGFPLTVPIVYAVDFDVLPAQMGAVSAYYIGCTSGRRPARLYGPRAVLDELKVGTWQAAGWNPSGGISAYASVVQRISPTVWPNNGELDEDAIVGPDHCLWLPDTPAPKPPTPVPVPTPVPIEESEVDHYLLLVNNSAPAGPTAHLWDFNTGGKVVNLTGQGDTVAQLQALGVKTATYDQADAFAVALGGA